MGKAMRCKQCRICDIAERKGRKPKPHKCQRNHTGSSKGMEAEMVVDMIRTVGNKGYQVTELAGDDDATGWSRAQNELKVKIKKRSDRNHVKTNVSKQLYALKTKEKGLSVKVINYIMRNFSYMLSQNQQNIQGIENGLKAVVGHMFGDHTFCDTHWCVFLENQTAKFRHLPYGKPL